MVGRPSSSILENSPSKSAQEGNKLQINHGVHHINR